MMDGGGETGSVQEEEEEGKRQGRELGGVCFRILGRAGSWVVKYSDGA